MQYPTVLDKKIIQQQATLTLHVPSDLIYFQGHFPDFPILPGVVQLDWAMYFASNVLNVPTPLSTNFHTEPGCALQIEQLKFTQAILPSDTIQLQLDYQPPLLIFKYLKANKPCAFGKIKLGVVYD